MACRRKLKVHYRFSTKSIISASWVQSPKNLSPYRPSHLGVALTQNTTRPSRRICDRGRFSVKLKSALCRQDDAIWFTVQMNATIVLKHDGRFVSEWCLTTYEVDLSARYTIVQNSWISLLMSRSVSCNSTLYFQNVFTPYLGKCQRITLHQLCKKLLILSLTQYFLFSSTFHA